MRLWRILRVSTHINTTCLEGAILIAILYCGCDAKRAQTPGEGGWSLRWYDSDE